MFTGLVEEVGVVLRVDRARTGGKLVIGARKVMEGTRRGDSIAVSGACLTVVDLGREEFTVECMPETLSRTTLGTIPPGGEVNLERALALGARIGGHLVLGHVDAVAEVTAAEEKGISLEVVFSLPDEVRPFIAGKGSVAVDGVSLTVARADEAGFVVGLIPYTVASTTLRRMRVGVRVNLEADIVARYLLRLMQAPGLGGSVPVEPVTGLTEELLRDEGFA